MLSVQRSLRRGVPAPRSFIPVTAARFSRRRRPSSGGHGDVLRRDVVSEERRDRDAPPRTPAAETATQAGLQTLRRRGRTDVANKPFSPREPPTVSIRTNSADGGPLPDLQGE